MGMEKVREEVIAKAKREAAKILGEAKKESDSIISEAQEKAEGSKKQAMQDAEREQQELRTMELASAELDVTKTLLDAKKRTIEEVFEEAKSRLARTPTAERRKHIKRLLDKAKGEIEVHRIFCSEKDINNAEGFKSQPANISGGIIAENKEGTIRLDYSYEAILEKTREEILKDVAKILYKTE